MPTTTLLEPSDTLTPAPPHASITVRDLVDMLGHEDADALVYVAFDEPPDTEKRVFGGEVVEEVVHQSNEVDFQPTSGIERRWYGGRKVVVVR